MGRTFDRGVLVGVGLLVAVLMVTAALNYRNTQRLNEDTGRVVHTQEVLDLTGGVLLALVDAETGQRGFLITGKDEFLQPYDAALTRLDQRVAALKDKARDSGNQSDRIARLEALTAVRLALLKEGIAARRKSAGDAQSFVAARKGKEQMDAVRAVVAAMEGEERDVLNARQQQSARSYTVAVITDLLTAAVGLVMVGAFVWLLNRSLSVRQKAAAAIQEQRELFRTTLASIGDAVITADVEGRITFVNTVARTLTGWSPEEAAGQPLTSVFHIVNEQTRQPADDPASRSLREGTMVGLANHTLLIARDGTERPIDDSTAPIRDAAGRVRGVVLVFRDVTERRRAQRALEQREEELRRRVAQLSEAEGRIRSVVNNVIDGIITIDAHGTVRDLNPAAERIFGYAAAEVVGRNVKLLMPEPYHSEHDRYLANYLRTGQAKIIGSGREVVGRRQDGSTFPMELAVGEFRMGPERFFTGVVRDITERRRVEQTLRVLGDASATLGVLVDYESTLQKVAGLAVPRFADWCAVDLVEADGSLRRVAVAHVDRAKIHLALELHRRYPAAPDSAHGPPQVLCSGQSDMMADIPDALIEQGARDAEHLRILRELGLKSYMCVPLQGRGRLLGVISFVSTESGRRYTPADLAFAEELARRAAMAIENAQLYAELRDADRRKDEFLATLAHELRNPLAPIRTSVELLRKVGPAESQLQQVRDMIDRQVTHMVRLVDDLLEVSRITRGKIELQRERVDLAKVAQDAIETSGPLIEAARHELAITVPPLPVPVQGDPVRLTQVVANLLNNAAKYTPDGGHIGLAVERQGGAAVIRVLDNGAGIPADMLPKVFDLFTQVNSTLQRSQGGLEIGLALVKRLVEMHGGSVEVRSEGEGRGSEFIVRLPAADPDGTAAGEQEDQGQPMGVSARRILVVDDNVDAANSLSTLLVMSGHDVRTAYDGRSAIEQAATFRPDVILLDLGMPGMNGYETARKVRELQGMEKVRLVALTGWGQEEDRRRTREAGFDAHLVKPVSPAALQELLTSRQTE